MADFSIVLPAHNEAAHLGDCLDALLASDLPDGVRPELLVVENGSTDRTAEIAEHRVPGFVARGWGCSVLRMPGAGKPAALNAGDMAARHDARLYLDADVTVSPPLLAEIAAVLAIRAPRFVTGTLRITAPPSAVSRAYARIWAQVPFMADSVPGCGLFAVNASGRARWDAFPPVISDDTFARLSFAPEERIAVPARYDWPVVSGLRNLIRVRARQNRGVEEIRNLYPGHMDRDDARPFPMRRKLALAARDPAGFAVYAGIGAAARLAPATQDWSRGR